MIHLQIRPSYRKNDLSALLIKAAEAVLTAEKKVGDLTIVLTGDKEIRELNRDFRQQDKPTDVLSFPSDEVDPETGAVYFGDVILSMPRAKEQAVTENHPIEDELNLLVVHGVLHLLGYDHLTAGDRVEMWKHQAGILSDLGVSMSSFTNLEA